MNELHSVNIGKHVMVAEVFYEPRWPLGTLGPLFTDNLVATEECVNAWGAMQHQLGPSNGAYWPLKVPFW